MLAPTPTLPTCMTPGSCIPRAGCVWGLLQWTDRPCLAGKCFRGPPWGAPVAFTSALLSIWVKYVQIQENAGGVSEEVTARNRTVIHFSGFPT